MTEYQPWPGRRLRDEFDDEVGGDVLAEPPAMNFYKLTLAPVTHDVNILISAEPQEDVDWASYAVAEFGQWHSVGEEYQWRPIVPGSFQIIGKLEIGLSTNAHQTTRMNITTLNGPIDNLAGGHDNERFAGPNQPNFLETWCYDRMYANAEGIATGDMWWGANGYWRRGASETCTSLEWTIRVAKYEPGHSDLWGSF